MSKPTIEDLRGAAKAAIEKRQDFVLDCASEMGQMVDNVAHMRFFEREVMLHMANEFEKYAHLAPEVAAEINAPRRIRGMTAVGPRGG